MAWHGAEHYFKKISADVLVIFDCCEAGTLRANSRASARHSFEFLGACDYDQYTPTPGQHSFTSGLIWALGQLKHHPGFDSAELREKIMSAPNAEGKRLTPVLFPREHPNVDHVWIAPKSPGRTDRISGTPTSPNGSVSSAHYREDRPMEFLDMRFRFSKRQTEPQVQRFSEALSQFARDQGSNLGVRRVELIDHASVFRDAALILGKRGSVNSAKSMPCNEDEEDEEECGGTGDPAAQRPGGGEAAEEAGEEASRPNVQNVNVGLLQVNRIVAGSQLMRLEVFGAFVFGIMCTLLRGQVSFAPLTSVLELLASWSGWILSCGQKLLTSD